MRLFKKISLLFLALILMTLTSTIASAEDFDEPFPLGDAGFDALMGTTCCFLWAIPFIIGLLIGIWVYKDAERRGKSGILWFLVVWIIPFPIGLIFWFLVRPPLPGEANQSTININNQQGHSNAASGFSNDRRCPNCGRGIPMDANVCPYCGKRFEQN